MIHIWAFFLPVLFAAFACSDNKPDGMAETETPAPEEMITLTPDQFQSSGMQTGQMSVQVFSTIIKANGKIDVPPEHKAAVSAYYGGYVRGLELLPGQKIAKGQLLFVLENPEYVQMQQDYLEAKGQLAYLEADYERQKTLADDNVTSKKNYLKAEADYKVTLARFEALKKKLSLINLDPAEVTENSLKSVIAVKAPIGGYVTAVNANQGKYLNPSDVAVEITNVDHLHLELNVFEKDMHLVKKGQRIRFKSLESDQAPCEGNIYLVGKIVDPITRIINIHGHLADEKQSLLFTPGMYIEAEILVAGHEAKSLPQESVVSIEDQYYVLVKKTSAETTLSFEKREVQVGKTENGFVEILNAGEFAASDEFLVSGAFNLIVE